MIASDSFLEFCRGYFAPADRLTPSQWCERHLTLPVGHSETDPGRVRLDKSPYLREPLDCLATPGVTDIVFAAPTRVGKTFLLRLGFAYSIAGDPAPMLWVDSTVDKGASIVRKELKPLVDANPILAARRPADRHHYSTREILFPGAAFNVYGANSSSQVAGDTVKRVFGNEVAKWQGATEEEAAILELVRHRTESYDDERRHMSSSTPRTEDDLFWLEMLKGDMRIWHAVCPACSRNQALTWEHVVWSPDAKLAEGRWNLVRVRETARYSCANPDCPHHDPSGLHLRGWTDEQRLAAIEHPAAHWRPTQEGHPGYRSYHLNGLYGRRKANRMGELAVDFLSARSAGFITDRQDFWNSRMGMPWVENPVELTVKKLTHLERQYDRGSLPAGWRPDLLVLEFDVQTYGMPWVVRAFQWSGESYCVDHGLAATWADLDQVETDYRAKLGASALFHAIGDINFEDRRAEVLEQIWRRSSRGWLAADGVEFSKERVRLEAANVFMGGKLQGEKIRVPKLVISTYDFKRELEQRFAGELKNWWIYQLPLTATETEVAEAAEYKAQLLDERRVPRKRRRAGMPAFEFKSRTGNNHAYDCEVYGLALFWMLQRRRSYTQRQPQPGQRRVMQVTR